MAADGPADPLRAGSTMTCVAVMVVLLVVPRTRTLSPVVMALAEAGLACFWYVVADASLTVTFWPADVVIVNRAVDRLPTVPAAPPAAGPDRALDPPPPADDPVGTARDRDGRSAGHERPGEFAVRHVLGFFRRCLYMRLAGDAGTATEATRKVAERLAGAG